MAEYPKPMTKHCTKKLIDQMEKYLYKLNEKEETYEIGFFCHINHQNKKIPVLITNNNILDDKNDLINISLNDITSNVKLGKTKYINTNYNLTIIEIEEKKDYNINFIFIFNFLVFFKFFKIHFFIEINKSIN